MGSLIAGNHEDLPPRTRAASLVVLALAVLLPLFPPENHGRSMLGCAVLVVALALLLWTNTRGRWGPAVLVIGAVAAWPASLAARAPGAVVEPFATTLVACAAGIYVAALPAALRRSPAIPAALAATGAWVSLRAVYDRLWGLEARAAEVAAAPAFADQAAIVERLREGRAFEPFATPAALGCFLAITIPVTVGAALSRRGSLRWLLFAAALLQVAGLLAAASVGAVAALLGALALSAVVRRPPRRLIGPAIAVLLLALLGVIAIRGETLWRASDPNSPWRLRAGNFRVAWTMFLDHPWVGVGPGGFGERFPGYRRPGDNEAQHAHNLPLELAAETGVVGGVTLGAVFFCLFLGPLTTRRRTHDPPWLRGASLGLAAFALHNLVDFTAFWPSLLWLAAVLRGALGRVDERPVTPEPAGRAGYLVSRFTDTLPISPALRAAGCVVSPPNTPGIPSSKRLASDSDRSGILASYRRNGTLAAAALAVTLLAALVSGLSGIADDQRLAAQQAALDGERSLSRRLAARATRLAPWNVGGWLLRAQARLDRVPGEPLPASRREQALRDLDRAIRLSPVRPFAHRLRASLRAERGDLAGAYADLVAAAELYPMRGEYAEARDELAGRLREAYPRLEPPR